MEDAVSARLAVIELRLSEITEQLTELRADLGAALGNRDKQ
ncbi:hypothetical protein ATK36_0707 [Amycolatopsis sulphurea]|uniref:Uncharacterized protein n=1 Tax=Amycolatopsis sulphurea TaxID=76022 RepID=A0A2A9G1W1_9PSEU|nr:hypothetical protein ATK36_0707 [Amycolatopsis sulphurea]